MNTFGWLLRREFWENRAIWIIPCAIGGLMVLAALFGRIDMISLSTQMPGRAFGGAFLLAVSATYFAFMSIYSTWYLLDCLYADRRDKSVLFWKSLPISDTITVLSKLATALAVIPLLYFLAADVTALLIAFIVSVRAGAQVGGALWHVDLWLQLQGLWLYLLVTSAIWYLPLAGYLMVVSAWAKRAVMLWSLLLPLALMLVERWFLGSHRLAHLLAQRLIGLFPVAFHAQPGNHAMFDQMFQDGAQHGSIWPLFNVSGFVSSPDTWLGVLAGALLIAGAIQLRMRRAEI